MAGAAQDVKIDKGSSETRSESLEVEKSTGSYGQPNQATGVPSIFDGRRGYQATENEGNSWKMKQGGEHGSTTLGRSEELDAVDMERNEEILHGTLRWE